DAALTAAKLANEVNGQLIGDGNLSITGLNEIHHVTEGDLCFVDHPKYYEKTLASAASVILIDQDYDCPQGKALIVVEQPFYVFDTLVRKYQNRRKKNTAALSQYSTCVSLKIGKNTIVETGVELGDYVSIGKNCHLYPNVVIGDGTVIGDNVVVQAGSIIGGEAFYFKKEKDGYRSWASGGRVVLEDKVEIGPGCTIARGVSSDTVIGLGSKLDAQVQIGHDCKIGKHCLFAAQVGIAGNTTVGDWTIMQGQVGVAQNLVIGPETVILAKSGVSKSLEGGKHYFGYPAQEAKMAFKDLAIVRRIRKEKEN
ncbi:MAG: LpxD N-terminal domain-containing protein, partial [Bacteroidota bacterium]